MAAPAEHDKLAEVVEAGTAIARGLDLDETLQAVVEAATRVTGAAYGALGVLGPDRRISRFITTGLSDEERELLGNPPTGRGILGVLIDEARPLRLLDLSDDPRSVGFPPNHPPMHSFLGVPVAGRGSVYGNLYLTEAPDGAFTDEDERIVVLLAGMAAVAIENARLFQDATEQAEQARHAAEARVALTSAAAAVLHEHDLMEALRLVAREAVRLLRVRLVAVAVPDEFAGVVRYDVAEGPDAGAFDTSAVPLGDSFAGSVLLAGVSIHVDGRETSALGSFVSAKRLAGHDVIAQPVVVGDEPAAVLLAADREDGAQLSDDDQELLGVLATFAAIAVHTSRSLARERARAEALARLRQTQTDAEARRETLSRVIETQERERRRLAQDLHDRTAGGLTSVLFALRRLERELDDGDQRTQLGEARAGVSAAIEDVRDLIADLRPKVLDDFGLGPALERLCSTVARRSGLALRPELGEGLDTLAPEVATAVYRIVQEALGNVVRHAHAQNVGVTAAILGEHLVVTVEDDGRGFSPGSMGHGIEGMLDRARMVAGRVDLESPAGGGARVRFEMQIGPA
ncbi:MAG: GAF domain-containing sensor histidine kinase [Actinomycetota bacterium]|nr:GAF domain-containing sensor histidine kinase [Actinomycetota bacterium]